MHLSLFSLASEKLCIAPSSSPVPDIWLGELSACSIVECTEIDWLLGFSLHPWQRRTMGGDREADVSVQSV